MEAKIVNHIGVMIHCTPNEINLKKIAKMEYNIMNFIAPGMLYICKETEKVKEDDLIKDLRKVGVYVWKDSIKHYDILLYSSPPAIQPPTELM